MMSFLLIAMVVVYVLSCLFMIVVILGQEGKGGGLSGLIGASALGDTLGASAAESTLRRWTRNSAILFVVLSLGLTIVGARVFTGSPLDLVGGSVPEEEVTEPTQEAITTKPLTARQPSQTAPPVSEPPTTPIGKATPAPAPKLPAGTPAPVSAPAPVPSNPPPAPTSPTR